MELFEALPSSLQSSLKHELPPSIVKQLEFLWEALHMVSTSRDLSLVYSRRFLDLLDLHGVEIPSNHSLHTRLCGKCSIIQLPTITVRSRIHSIKLRSRINRKRSAPVNFDPAAPLISTGNDSQKSSSGTYKVKSVLMSHCLCCGHTYHGIGHDTGVLRNEGRLTSETSNRVSLPASAPIPSSKKKKPFSFTNTTSTSGIRGIGTSEVASSFNSNTSTAKISLLDIERARKKQKRQEAKKEFASSTAVSNMDSGFTHSATNTAPKQSTLKGLGSLLRF